jgi:sensor c-di-GMP phosphodiesterase-like protein
LKIPLRHLPVDSLKIDKTFIDEINQNASEKMIIKTIIDLGINLNFKLIAEGIETKDQQEFLKQSGFQIGQGYHFSKPLPVEQVEQYLAGMNQQILSLH